MTLMKLHWLKVVAIVGVAGVIAGADAVVRQKPAPVVGTPAKTVAPVAAAQDANRRPATTPNAAPAATTPVSGPSNAAVFAGDVDSQQVLEHFRAGTAQFVDARIHELGGAGAEVFEHLLRVHIAGKDGGVRWPRHWCSRSRCRIGCRGRTAVRVLGRCHRCDSLRRRADHRCRLLAHHGIRTGNHAGNSDDRHHLQPMQLHQRHARLLGFTLESEASAEARRLAARLSCPPKPAPSSPPGWTTVPDPWTCRDRRTPKAPLP